MSSSNTVVIVGGGCFGASAALELRFRGYHVTIIDDLPRSTGGSFIPTSHDLASSTDTNKLIRPDYGDDVFYTDLMRQSMEQKVGTTDSSRTGRRVHYLPGWKDWDRFFAERLFHQTGLLLMDKKPWLDSSSSSSSSSTSTSGSSSSSSNISFTELSYRAVLNLNMKVERVRQHDLQVNHPGWDSNHWKDGYINYEAGWADSGRVVTALLRRAAEVGVTFVSSRASKLLYSGSRVIGVETFDGKQIIGDHTIVAAGAWTPTLVPWLSDVMWPVAQLAFHFQPPSGKEHLFDGESGTFPAWGAAIRETGFYGFPLHPRTGWVKVGHHGIGFPLKGIEPRRELLEIIRDKAKPLEEPRFRAFLQETFPELARGPTAFVRLCLYCDTSSSDFLIDRDPQHPGLIVASGGSGHAFKFTPVLGAIIADTIEGITIDRFAWRQPIGERLDSARQAAEVSVIRRNTELVAQAVAELTSRNTTTIPIPTKAKL